MKTCLPPISGGGAGSIFLDIRAWVRLELMKLRRNVDLRIEPNPFASMDENDPSGFLAEIKRSGIRVA
jgi:hypothetical protein